MLNVVYLVLIFMPFPISTPYKHGSPIWPHSLSCICTIFPTAFVLTADKYVSLGKLMILSFELRSDQDHCGWSHKLIITNLVLTLLLVIVSILFWSYLLPLHHEAHGYRKLWRKILLKVAPNVLQGLGLNHSWEPLESVNKMRLKTKWQRLL